MESYEYLMVGFELFIPELIEQKMNELGSVGWIIDHVFECSVPDKPGWVYILLSRVKCPFAEAEPVQGADRD